MQQKKNVQRQGWGAWIPKWLKDLSFVVVILMIIGPQSESRRQIQAQISDPCVPPILNPIACENSKPGNPSSEWDITGAGDENIRGFATDISVDQGQTVHFKIDTDAEDYRLDIYRMGYYGGLGARKVVTIQPSALLPQIQPECLTDVATGLIDCGNWSESASWSVPSDATSGIYFAKLIREDGTPGTSHIVFIVRDDDGFSDLLLQTSDTTWQAYNAYGGNSLYVGGPATSPNRAYKVSYNRPFTTRATASEDWVFNAEYPMVRWLEANGYNVSYFTGVDSDRRGSEILEHEVFLSVGHDEYWSGAQRTNVEAARNAGVNLAFFSGNGIFWKTRWENSIDGSNTSHRTLISYKETHANLKIDPQPNGWTGTWRDPRFSPPADGGRPENELTGTLFMVNSGTTAIEVPEPLGKHRFWRNTSVASLAPGQVATLEDNTLGYEWDEAPENGFQPPGLMRLSSTTSSNGQYLLDFGSTYGSGTATHSLTLYRHSSGAWVFGAGTIQWSWGLDGNHDRGGSTPDVRMQQATVNLFADMGVQPDTLQPGLAPAAASTDTIAPTSLISFPTNGSSVQVNVPLTVSGTASDSGGGIVTKVEVSLDGGATWTLATGTGSWSYAWTPETLGEVTIQSRALDDSVNLQSPPANVTATVTTDPPPPSCPCSLWNDATTPAVAAENDSSAVEIGVQFQSTVAGYITALRFYKGPGNTGAHVGKLWASDGTLLASVTFASETATGWQQVNLAAPVAIAANTTYVASYHAPAGHYAVNGSYFSTEFNNPPLRAPASGAVGGNGVFQYGSSGFPTETFNASNYWVDMVFETELPPPDTTPPTVTNVSPTSGATGVAVSSTVTATFDEAMDAATINANTFELRNATNALVAASVSYNAGTHTATLAPTGELTAGMTYTATVKGGGADPRVKDAAGNALTTNLTWNFTSATPPNEGPGGPILIITSPVSPFSRYYGEILRTEGLNAFITSDINSITAMTLTAYDVVILGTMSLTAAQVTMFSDWVHAGGNLIAMRPDKQLAGLLGLLDGAATLSDAYLLVNTTSPPSAGIVNETLQFHDTADLYALNGASSVATLYQDAVTATASPAVTIRVVGANGGQAAAFTYDLARSIVYIRQGNPAWSGQERDAVPPLRSDDLFFGAAPGDPQPDWVDLNKVVIPQADEQQRLLANLILHLNADKMPLPRFWYFPRGLKAVVIMTGDDHANGGTAGRFDQYLADSSPGCSVENWECIRGTSYIYPNTPLTDAQAAAYMNAGFEIALHVNTGCDNWTAGSLASFYSDQIGAFGSAYPSLPSPATNRTHCIVWSDYATQAQVEFNNGIRLDTNYYYYPPSWVADQPGLFTGSGMPMRFASASGSVIDVYQAATQLTDESGQTYPFTIDALLDRALGPEGYYGAFTANIHTDVAPSSLSDAVVNSAQSRGVPVITARQMLTWLDGRNSSSFGSLSWNDNTLNFSIVVGSGANQLQALVPVLHASGPLTGIVRNGNPIAYTVSIIKGVEYAVFPAIAGAYQATYAIDTTPPVVVSVSPLNGATDVAVDTVVMATFNEAMDAATINAATFELRDVSNALVAASVSYNAGTRTATLTPSNVLSLGSTYTATVKGGGTDPRVKDTAGNALAADFTWSFTTTATALVCPCSLWDDATTPATPAVADALAVELGVKFHVEVNGYIIGIRFYKGAGNTGTHVGNLWTSDGTLLGSVTFTNETATGWQQAPLATPVAVTTGTTYVVSYHAPNGNYAANANYFTAEYVNAPLRALATGVSGGNGVYRYGASGFPTNTYNASNYWVDVVFDTVPSSGGDITLPTVTSVNPVNGTIDVSVNTVVTATFNEAMDAATINTGTFELRDASNALMAASVSYNAETRTATLTPSSALSLGSTYAATVRGGGTDPRVKDTAGNALATNFTWSFTTSATPLPPVECPCSLWDDTTAPALVSDPEASAIEVGMKFQAEVSGYIMAIRFYKGVENTGTHVGNLWASDGTLLATVTFTNETATGWQQAELATPVAITANTTYVVSYHAPNGRYAVDEPYFTTEYINSPLQAPASGVSGGNGVYQYGASGFPTETYNASNYWVDVVFDTELPPADTTPPTVTTVSPSNGATDVAVNTNVTATFDEVMDVGTVNTTTIELRDNAQALVPASVSYDGGTHTATLTPSSALAQGVIYTATVLGGGSGVKDVAGNALAANFSWAFTTVAPPPPPCPCSVWDDTTTPAVSASGDPSAVELGMKFQSEVSGYITGIRFYKGAGNTGTHVGNLWASDGTLLATVTFADETATGWQQAALSTPVAVTANTTYVVSYHAPNGNYAFNGAYFGAEYTNSPLRVLASGVSGGNGVYLYGASGFPTNAFNAANYWVDVVFDVNP